MNNLLLTSDLKGYIEKPNYYFINPGDETNAGLDVLMLTQGYRRFEWKQAINGIAPQVTWQPERGLGLEGIVKTQAGNPVYNGKVTLAAIREGLFKDTVTDAEGQFRFTGLYLSDTSKVLLHAIRANNSGNVKIEVKQTDDPPVIPQKEININNASSFSPALLTQLRRAYNGQKEHDSLNNVHHLKEVKIWSGKLNQEPDVPFSANLNGPGHADQIIMGDKLTGCIYISDCLLGKIAGVFYQRGKFYTMRAYSDHIKPIPMVIIVDGNLQDESHLNDLNAEDVNSIEVLISGNYLAMYGSNAAGGALVITTKKISGNKYVNSKTPSDLMSFLFKGFYLTKSFYSPKYKHPKTETEAADLRSTIYWNPNINTDKDGKASFEYFNADTKGTYRVVIEGIDDDGDLGRQVFRYKVE